MVKWDGRKNAWCVCPWAVDAMSCLLSYFVSDYVAKIQDVWEIGILTK